MNSVSFSPEMQFLLVLCRAATGGEKIQPNTIEQNTIESNTLDWREFYRLIIYHRLLPVVFPLIKDSPPAMLPKEQFIRLSLRYEEHKRFSRTIARELEELFHLFQRRGIDVIALKGPPLAMRYYGDNINRHHGDIDLLAAKRDIDTLHQLVSEKGYQTGHGYLFQRPVHKSLFFFFDNQVPYVHESKRIRLELHSRLFNNRHLLPIPPSELFERARSLPLRETPVKTLDIIDNILYLFAHGANHRWFRLKWLLDIHMLTRHPDWNWETIIQRARETGLETVVKQGLLLSRHLFHTASPADFPTDLPGDMKENLSYLTRHAMKEISKSSYRVKPEGLPGVCRKIVYTLRLKRGFRFKLKKLDLLLFQEKNTRILRLPDILTPLYIILNPFLAFYRKVFIRRGRRC